MTRDEIVRLYSPVSAAEQRSFAEWLASTGVVASLFAMAFVAIAWAGIVEFSSTKPVRTSERATEVSAAGGKHVASHSPQEMMRRLAADQLPVRQVSEAF
jgi:hypothetical protein